MFDAVRWCVNHAEHFDYVVSKKARRELAVIQELYEAAKAATEVLPLGGPGDKLYAAIADVEKLSSSERREAPANPSRRNEEG